MGAFKKLTKNELILEYNEDNFDLLFNKYDVNKNGRLNKEEMGCLMMGCLSLSQMIP